jgi:hypothetical protein
MGRQMRTTNIIGWGRSWVGMLCLPLLCSGIRVVAIARGGNFRFFVRWIQEAFWDDRMIEMWQHQPCFLEIMFQDS